MATKDLTPLAVTPLAVRCSHHRPAATPL